MSALSYAGIDEAVLIHALYHGTQALGLGQLHDMPDLTVEQVRADLERQLEQTSRLYIDYYRGRPFKTHIDTVAKTFTTRLYDRDAGDGAAERVLSTLRGAH